MAIVGFAVTLTQVARVKSAVTRYATRSASEMLLVAVSQMEHIERDLRQASASGALAEVERAAIAWRGQAASARTLLPLSQRGASDEALAQSLELSLAMVSIVLVSLDEGPGDLPVFLGPLLQQVDASIIHGRALAMSIVVTDERDGTE